MANNPYVNKVVYEGSTLVDLTDATATADKILEGYTAYGADGSKLMGTAVSGSVTQDQDGFIILPATGGGSGGSNYTLLAEQDITISTTNTSATLVESIYIEDILNICDSGEKIIFISIFDKAGARNGYYYGSLSYSSRVNVTIGTSYYQKANGTTDYASINYGIYPSIVNNYVQIYSRYVSSFGTLSGTFNVRIYTLDFPAGVNPFV